MIAQSEKIPHRLQLGSSLTMRRSLDIVRRKIDVLAGPMRVLVIDDNALDRDSLQKMIDESRLPRCQSTSAESVETATEQGKLTKADLILLDDHLSGKRAEDSIKAIRNNGAQCPIIIVTGVRKKGRDIDSLRLGAIQFADKNTLDAAAMQRLVAYGASCRKRAIN